MSRPDPKPADDGRLLPRERAPYVDPGRWAFGAEDVLKAKVGGRIERHNAITGEPDRS